MAAVSPAARAHGIAPLSAPQDAAFAEFYARHSSRVFGFCLKWLRSREEAEDALQTTFLYAWRGLGRGVVPTFESAWVLSIARNVCLSLTDAGRRRAGEEARDPHLLEDTVAAPAQSDELRVLPEALAALTEQQRRAIVMREWRGMSYMEIAEELELSQSAVETLLFRARRSLARQLRRLPSVGSFVPWLKSLLGGAAAKFAVGATIVAVTVAAGEVVTHPSGSAAKPTLKKQPSAAAVPLAQRPTSSAVRHATRSRAATRVSKRIGGGQAVAPVVQGFPGSAPLPGTPEPLQSPATQPPAAQWPAAPAPAALPRTAKSPAGGAASAAGPAAAGPSAPPLPAPPTGATDSATAAVGTVNATAGTVVGAATDTAATVVGAATDTAATVVGAAGNAAGTVVGAASDAAGTVTHVTTTVVDTVQSTVSTVTTAVPVPAPALPALPPAPPPAVALPPVPAPANVLPPVPAPPKLLP